LFRDTKFRISVWIVLAKILSRLSLKEHMPCFSSVSSLKSFTGVMLTEASISEYFSNYLAV